MIKHTGMAEKAQTQAVNFSLRKLPEDNRPKYIDFYC